MICSFDGIVAYVRWLIGIWWYQKVSLKYRNLKCQYEYNFSEKESVFHAATLLLKSTSLWTSVVTNNSRSIYSMSETLNFVGGSNRMKYSTLGNDWSPKKADLSNQMQHVCNFV